MRPKTMILLAGLAILLLIIAFATRRAERSGERIASGAIFPGLTREAVAGIRVTGEEKTVELRRDGALWRVASEGDYPADTLAVSRILEKLPLFDRRHLRSNAPDMQETFEVGDAQGLEVAFTGADGAELARFRVGKNGPDFRSQYVRPSGSREVYLIPDHLRSVLDPQRPTWRDRALLAFDRDRVARVTFHPAEGAPVVAVKDEEGQFALAAPAAGPLKTQVLDATLRTLSNLRCDAFADTLLAPAAAGLEPPRQRVEIQLQDGAQFGVDFGNEIPAGGRTYVRKDGTETLYLISTGRIPSLVRTLEDLREAPPATGEATEG